MAAATTTSRTTSKHEDLIGRSFAGAGLPWFDDPIPAGRRPHPAKTVKTRYVSDLQPDESVTSYFLVQQKDVRLKKSGEPYLSLVLADRTGRLEAKMWDGISEVAETFGQDDFVKVQGLVNVYRERPQMTIHRLRCVDESEVDISQYFPHTERDIDEMWAELTAAVSAVGNPHIKSLLEKLLADEEIATRMKRAPAAKTLHHAFIGGLLEHVTSLLRLAKVTAANYEFVDADLVTAGVVLHDLGKIYELEYKRTFGYSDEGQLLGHIIIVLRLLDRKCAEIADFPPKLKMLIEHLILSHHGQYEFGSPKLPMFPEALLLHQIDDLDSKLESMRASTEDEVLGGEYWTRYNPSLERRLLKKEAFLSENVAGKQGTAKPARSVSAGAAKNGPGAGQPEPRSLFGEKLKNAITADKKDS